MKEDHSRTKHNASRGNNRARAFTLIELLVVVAIITILMGILLPSLSSARRQAKRVKCLANMRSMGIINSLYAEEYNQYVPIACAAVDKQSNYWFNRDGEQLNLFGRYYKAGLLNSPQVVYCPEMKDELHMYNSSSNTWPPPAVLPSNRNVRASYSMRGDYRIQWVSESNPSIKIFAKSYPVVLADAAMPKLRNFENKVIMCDLIRNTTNVSWGHLDGMVFLRADGSTGWQKYGPIQKYIIRLTDMVETNNPYVDGIFAAMDAN